jgi:hypothetical protein
MDSCVACGAELPAEGASAFHAGEVEAAPVPVEERDRRPGRVERDAPPYLQAGGVLEPFAMRALGQVREDDELIRRALDRLLAQVPVRLHVEEHCEQRELQP